MMFINFIPDSSSIDFHRFVKQYSFETIPKIQISKANEDNLPHAHFNQNIFAT